MSKWKVSYLVVACTLLAALVVAQSPEIAPTKTTAAAHKVTLNATHLTARGFQRSAFVETGSTTDAGLATYNGSNQWEVLMPSLCAPSEYGGKRGIHLVSHLAAPTQDNFVVVITAYQPDAQYYGAPVTRELSWR